MSKKFKLYYDKNEISRNYTDVKGEATTTKMWFENNICHNYHHITDKINVGTMLHILTPYSWVTNTKVVDKNGKNIPNPFVINDMDYAFELLNELNLFIPTHKDNTKFSRLESKGVVLDEEFCLTDKYPKIRYGGSFIRPKNEIKEIVNNEWTICEKYEVFCNGAMALCDFEYLLVLRDMLTELLVDNELHYERL